jgi:hypothetical protein
VQGVVPRPDVAPLLQQHFVALAADADDADDEVAELAQNLENAYMLPFVLFAGPDGRFLGGFSGSVTPAAFVAAIEKVVESRA